ncbi:hypothetical protein IV203_032754 [Nitzschia inconspicua]|uniref:Uncharacterized protein n=1 Tax=Nitzschia inconspicua TaxID=303405 RepID=A0A9K3PF87_9STRA|nr:hypothetical protein IV203_032754 [Nitzschia inconspicua]
MSFSYENQSKKKQDELDSFLTTIESKLRGPFSSLDLAKAVSTAALRSSSSSLIKTTTLSSPTVESSSNTNATNAAKEYLQNLLCVFSRTDKVIQCRMLIGLMGLNDDTTDGKSTIGQTSTVSSLTSDVLEILTETQTAPLHEEWVRTTSGLIQGIMFRDELDNSRESCRGEEAAESIAKQQEEVFTKIQQYLEHQHVQDKNNTNRTTEEPDLNACFAPYRYSLISTPVLNTIIPEFRVEDSSETSSETSVHQNFGHNCHFHVNLKAEILQEDWKLEDQRAKEEEQHGGTGTAGLAGISGNAKDLLSNGDVSSASIVNLPPGFRPTKLVNAPKSAGAKSGSNLFMPKKPSSLLNTGNKGAPGAAKTLLRRKGGAQALVKGSSVKQRMAAAAVVRPAATTAGVTRTTGVGSTATPSAQTVGRFTGGGKGRSAMTAGRSKMKMIDLQEVSELSKQHQQEEEANNTSRASKRKRILEAAQKGMTGTNKKAKSKDAATATAPPTPVANDHESTSAAKYQAPSEPSQPVTDWEIAMNLPGTNKMSEDDKKRVKLFLDKQSNPTPTQPTYKIKIHEQRGADPTTGEDTKETYYLALNYDDFTHKITKKIKRYQ